MINPRPQLKCKSLTIELDHNPYEVSFYNLKKDRSHKVIIFPLFHYDGFRQFYDLLVPIINEGHRLVVVKLLNKKDRVLFSSYYFSILKRIIMSLKDDKLIAKEDEITLLGFGVGAYLASKLHDDKDIKPKKLLLVSPINQYKDEYQISDEIDKVKIPTYIYTGQCDGVVPLEAHYKIYEKGHTNKNVHFSSYPVCGHYLHYKDILSQRLEASYKKIGYNALIGSSSLYKNSPLPEEAILNERFFIHLLNDIEDIPNKKRIALLTDICPLFINGVAMVTDLLQNELEKLGYEVYIVALWNKNTPYKELPNSSYIPVEASYASFLKGYKELQMLKTFNFIKSAKMLCLFGFDYLHLHTEYSMGQIALKLSKLSGVKFVYSYHTLWNLYYEQKFGKLMGDITYKAAKSLLFNQVYKDSEVITVPSFKSYEILSSDMESKKDIRILPSPINIERFAVDKQDKALIENLRIAYNLKDKKVLGYVGRVSMEKNILETLDFIARIKHEIPNVVFMIIGVGDAVPVLKKAVKKLNIAEQVIFVGEIENAKLKYYYSLFDVFVTASNFETQGLTYFEAAASGTLILAKKDKAIENVFIDGDNAFIYDDFYQWTERLERALFSNCKSIVANAYKTVNKYTSDKWAKQLLSMYKELNPEK